MWCRNISIKILIFLFELLVVASARDKPLLNIEFAKFSIEISRHPEVTSTGPVKHVDYGTQLTFFYF